MSPQTLSALQEYREKVDITKKFTGELRKLVDIEFPAEMDAPQPPIFQEIEDEFYEPAIRQDSDNYEESDSGDEVDSDEGDSDEDVG